MSSLKRFLHSGCFGIATIAFVLFAASSPGQVGKPALSEGDAQKKIQASASRFLENKGQWDRKVQFLARTPEANVWLTRTGVVYDFFKVQGKGDDAHQSGHAISMELDGAKLPKMIGRGQTSLRTDFITPTAHGNITGARSYGEVIARGVYPGINLRHYFDNGRPRYDFLISRGADPSDIRFSLKGTDKVRVASNGDLVIGTTLGNIRHAGLAAHQMVDGKKKSVTVKFVKLAANQVGFKLGDYDVSRPLVIDPLVYGSYYGGDGGWDEVRAVVADADGGVYITGATRSAVFPNIYGPYGFNIKGTWDAYISKFQGDAYSHDYCAYVGGSLSEAGDRIQIDPFGDIWIGGRTESSDYPGNTRPNVQYIRETTGFGVNGGQYRIQVLTDITNQIPVTATNAVVQAALEALPSVGAGNVTVTGGPLHLGFQLRVAFDNSVPWIMNIRDHKEISNPSTGAEFIEGVEPVYVIRPIGQFINPQQIVRTGSSALSGSFRLTFTDTFGASDTTAFLPYNAQAGAIEAALLALNNIDPGEVVAAGGMPGGCTVTFQNGLAGPQLRMEVDSRVGPFRDLGLFKYTDIFLHRFKKSTTSELDPLPTRTYMIGAEGSTPSDFDEPPGGQLQPFGRFHNPIHMVIVPKDNPLLGDPVEIIVASTTGNDIPGVSGSVQGLDGFVYRVNFQNDTFNDVVGASQYVSSSFDDELTGLACDKEGSIYVCGTIYGDVVYDTSVTPGIFDTTPGVFFEGRLLRGQDAYMRKYTRDGTLVYSALLGGNGSDDALGVCVDSTGSAYLTGIARSFNFPRTRGVFGEDFDANPRVYATKVNLDASEIVYSTHLRTVGSDLNTGPTGFIPSVRPRGIAVDSRGRVFIAGMLFPRVTVVIGQSVTTSIASSIPTTADALQPNNIFPGTPQIGTWDGFLMVLNQTATNLTYSTYIGGNLDEQVFAPHIDKVGDVWVVGSTDAFRFYATAAGFFSAVGQLPAQWISRHAFKTTPDASFASQAFPVPFGVLDNPFALPQFIAAVYQRDGFLVKVRLDVPTISDITLNPATVAGGLGASSNGLVTLSGAAPPGGLDIAMSLNDTAASFDPSSQQQTRILSIPGGATTGAFVVYTNPVPVATPVEVKASLEGNFQIAQLVVEPWLTQLTVTPTAVVGGNNVIGRIKLYQNAITDVVVDLSTDNSGLLGFPAQVTVPAGLDTITFAISTKGVDMTTTVPITASLLGVGRSKTVTLEPANLLTLTFNPARVTGGTASTGKVLLDGECGGTFFVDLTMVGGLPPGYSIDTGEAIPTRLTFNVGDREKTFTVQTAYEPNNTQKIIRATRPVQPPAWTFKEITGTLFIDNSNLISFTISPTTVDIGEDSIGTVTLSTPAGAGGAVVDLASSDPIIASVPAQVIVPSGATSANFTITVIDTALTSDATATITASRGPTSIDRVLTVRKTTLDLVITPSSVVGGQGATGTITLGAEAPSGGLVVDLVSSVPEAQVQAQVTVPVGATTVTFPITTSTVSSVVTATITATAGSLVDSANLQIKPIGVVSIKFNPSTVRGGLTSQCRITIDAPAPPGGALIGLAAGANGQIVILPPNVTIPQGDSQIIFTVQTRRVSRTLTTVVTATYNSSSASGSLTVRK